MLTHRFSRRTMLRGLGVSMALPWLESLPVWGDEPRQGRAASEAPVRFAVLFAVGAVGLLLSLPEVSREITRELGQSALYFERLLTDLSPR